MKNMLLTTLLLISAAENTCSERLAALTKHIAPYVSTIAAGSLAALKFGYDHTPSLNQMYSAATIAWYTTSILQMAKPNWFPGKQLGIIDPEDTRASYGTLYYDTQNLKDIFFTQWNEINDLIQYLDTHIKQNSEEENIASIGKEAQLNYLFREATQKEIRNNNAARIGMFQKDGWLRKIITNISTKFSKQTITNTFKCLEYKPSLEPNRYGYILQGPPGCGKTSLPIYLAKRYNCPLYTIAADKLSTGYSGSTVTNFKNVIEAAYKAASTVTNKIAIVTLEDIDTLFKSTSPEINLLQSYMLDFIQKMQSDSQTEQKSRQAEILFFCTSNYNKSKWMNQNALSRNGRLKIYDYKNMTNGIINDSSLLKKKIESASQDNTQTNKHVSTEELQNVKTNTMLNILNNNQIKIKCITLHNLLFPNIMQPIIQHNTELEGKNYEELYKTKFNQSYTDFKVSSIQKNDISDEYILTFDPIQYSLAVNFLGNSELKKLMNLIEISFIHTSFYQNLFTYLNEKKIEACR